MSDKNLDGGIDIPADQFEKMMSEEPASNGQAKPAAKLHETSIDDLNQVSAKMSRIMGFVHDLDVRNEDIDKKIEQLQAQRSKNAEVRAEQVFRYNTLLNHKADLEKLNAKIY